MREWFLFELPSADFPAAWIVTRILPAIPLSPVQSCVFPQRRYPKGSGLHHLSCRTPAHCRRRGCFGRQQHREPSFALRRNTSSCGCDLNCHKESQECPPSGLQRTTILRRRTARLYKGTSINVGPSPANAACSALPNSSRELTRAPGTPIPLAKSVQSRSGRPISNISAARGPGLPTPK
jgi:hypothetical protein